MVQKCRELGVRRSGQTCEESGVASGDGGLEVAAVLRYDLVERASGLGHTRQLRISNAGSDLVVRLHVARQPPYLFDSCLRERGCTTNLGGLNLGKAVNEPR